MLLTRAGLRRIVALAVLTTVTPLAAGAQTTPPQTTGASQTSTPPIVAPPPAEAADLAAGWMALSEKDAPRAAAVAAAVLNAHPRSIAALDLLVSAEVTLGGSLAGLAAYEQWLGARHLDDAYALRTVAMSVLNEAARDVNAPDARREAFDALAADGDRDALIALAQEASVGGTGATVLLAKLGSESAVKALIAQLQSGQTSKLSMIPTLASTHSPLAEPPLVTLLKDQNPDVRAAAADGLGTLGIADAAASIKPLLDDTIFAVHFAAASAMLKLKDTSGLTYLRGLEASEHPAVRAAALNATSVEPDATWVASVRALLQDSDPQVRLAAARLIAPYDADAARRTIEGLSSDSNLAIREEAGKVYINAIASDFRVLRGFLRAQDTVSRVRAAARILALTR